jgi:hypothetical protein
VPDPELEVLDQPGNWEIRVTIYRNGRKIATGDVCDHETFASAVWFAGQRLEARELDIHQPRPRSKP